MVGKKLINKTDTPPLHMTYKDASYAKRKDAGHPGTTKMKGKGKGNLIHLRSSLGRTTNHTMIDVFANM